MKDKWLRIFAFITEYSLYGLVLFIPISKAAVEVFFTIMLIGFFGKKALKRDFAFMKNPPHIFLLLFLGFSTLSLFNSGMYINKSFDALFFKWSEYIFIFLIAEDTLRNPKIRSRCISILLGVSFFVGLDAFSQRFLGFELFRHRRMVEIHKGLFGVTAAFKHYNSLGAYLVPILSLVLSQCLAIKEKILKNALRFLICVLTITLLLTFSRGAWLGFSVAMMLILVLSRKYKMFFLVLCLAVLILCIPVVRQRALFTFQKGGDATRFAIWQGGWSVIRGNPWLGKGVGTFMDYFGRYTSNLGIQYAHNSYLQIWAETGIFSLLSFLLFVSLVLFRALKTFKKNSDLALLGTLCGMCGLLIHGLFENHLYVLQLAVLFWFMLGALSTYSLRMEGSDVKK